MKRVSRIRYSLYSGVVFLLFAAQPAFSAPLVPGSADSSRIDRIFTAPPANTDDALAIPEGKNQPLILAPLGAEKLVFTLKDLIIDGATAYDQKTLLAPFQERLGKNVTLAEIYSFAAALQIKYQGDGYFLTRVIVPDQKIDTGVVHLQVMEGYIARVLLADSAANNRVVRAYSERIISERPLRSQTLEHALLGLNDLPGQHFRAVLSADNGENLITLIPQTRDTLHGSVGVDNYGSRFLGPHEVVTNLNGSLLPLQQTTLYGLTSVPTRELNYGTVRHSIVVAPDFTIQAEAGVTKAKPGYTLASLDIDSKAYTTSFYAQYQVMRERQQNLLASIGIETRNVASNVFTTRPLTREHVRVARAKLNYDLTDSLKGSNVINATLSQGIDGLGSSKKGDLNLSRGEAEPNFMKFELTVSRLQQITPEWTLLGQVYGQLANKPLYSSEELGYGGQTYGRAFDSSELVGDEGLNTALELHYQGLRRLQPINLEPYVFYDYGVVTNQDIAQVARDSAKSLGAGVRFASNWGQSGNLGIAFPVDHAALAPLYDGNPHSPRLMFQLNHNF